MRINLIAHTPMPLDVMYTACRTCYSKSDAGELWSKINSDEKMQELILKVLRSNHMSIAEHINFTFTIDGISRKTSHQLVRHRHCTFSQKSQRYVTYHKPFTYSTPASIIKNDEILKKYHKYMDDCQAFYNEMLEAGIEAEDARDIFPNACHTSITMTCNLREFIHICNERLCKRAQTEIRMMTRQMVTEVIRVPEFKFLEEFFTAHCKTCTEFDGCKNEKTN